MNYHGVTMEEVARVVSGIGVDGFKKLATQLPEVRVKYNKPLGQFETYLNMISLEDQKRVLAGEASIKIEDVVKSLFDSTGRVVCPRGFKLRAEDENRNFRLDQFNDGDCLKRMQGYLPEYTFSSLAEFQDKCGIVKERMLKHPLIGPNAFNRCNLPLPIPHIPELADINRLGQVLENLLKGVRRAYENEFNDSSRKFFNHCKGILAGEAYVISGIRHKEVLVAAAKASQTSILLPNSLQGYSIEAGRAIISLFPDFVSLVGLEYILAMIVYSNVLARDFNTPGLDMAALRWRSAASSLGFRSYDDRLDFHYTDNLVSTRGPYSGGLLFLE